MKFVSCVDAQTVLSDEPGFEVAARVVRMKISGLDRSGRSVSRFEMHDRVVLDSFAVPTAHGGMGDAQI